MANKTEKIDLKTLKPGTAESFAPQFIVANVEGRRKTSGDHIYATLKPAGGGADQVGTITLRMPAQLVPGSVLEAFTRMVGQDPAKGFDVTKAEGQRIAVTFAPVE